MQNPAERAKLSGVANQLSRGEVARHVDRSNIDLCPAALQQDTIDAMWVGEGKLSRSIRHALRDVRQQRSRSVLSDGHERIFVGASPSYESQFSIVSCSAMQVRKGPHRVVEKHDAEARNDRTETCRFKRVGLRVRTDEVCGGPLASGLRTRSRDHRLRDVDASTVALCAKRSRDGERSAAGTAAHVEYAVRICGDCGDQQLLKGSEHLVEQRLCVDPGESGDAVPERRLLYSDLSGEIHNKSPLICL